MSNWRLTLFRDDDLTPLVGSVAGEAVVEATCATDPAHPRPFLLVPETLAESEVNLAEGSSVIGQVNVRVLDKRRVPGDQATGWLTALLAVPGTGIGAGESALNGRRALLEQTDDGAAWFVLMDGIVGGVRLDESLVTYSIEIRDVRERERKVRAFLRADTATVLPRGVLGGYGRYATGGWGAHTRWLVPPTQPMVGEYRRESTTQGRVDVSGMWQGKKKRDVPPSLVVTPKVLETIKPEAKQIGKRRRFLRKPILQYRNVYARVRLLWRYKGSGAGWTEIRAPVAVQWGSAGLIRTKRGLLSVSDEDRPVVTGVREVVLATDAASTGLLPLDRRQVEVIVAYNGEPCEDYPLHIDGMTAGQLLKKLYDGDYSVDEEEYADDEPPLPPLKVRYDTAAVLALDTPVRARVTEPIDDLREWVQEHLYKPLGAAPALDARGRVSPIRYALPPADREIPTLDDTVTASDAGWEHAAGEAVNHVIVRYKRDLRVPLEDDPAGERSAGDGLSQVEAVVERIHAPSVEALGDKPLELEMEIFRAVGGVEGEPISGNVDSETAFALAMARADQALDRFVYGAQQVRARTRRSATASLRVGDWVFVNLSWLPDYRTGLRGGARLAQVTAVKDLDPAWRELTLVDAGPANQGHPLFPTLGTLAALESGAVQVPVLEIPGGGEARVEYAVADAVPPADAGVWLPLERTPVPAPLETPPLPPGVRVWVRARTEGPGTRPSPYTTPRSVLLPQAPRLGEVRLDVDAATREARVSWIPNDFARAVRLHWALHDPDAAPVFTQFVDVDATLAGALLPAQAVPGKTLSVEAEPWSGWTGAAATGTPGPRQGARWHLRAADTGLVRTAVEVWEDGTTGTLRLTVTDPEALVASVAFFVTGGTGVAGQRERTGPHPADEVPAAGVHLKRVALHDSYATLVEPVVTLEDGSTLRPGSETFDRNRTANLVGRPQVQYEGAQATVSVTGDADTVSLHAEEWTGSAWAAIPGVATPFATGQRGSFSVTAGATAQRRLRVFGRNGDGQAGPAEEVTLVRYLPPSPVTARFWTVVDAATNRADLYLGADGPASAFPVQVQIHPDNPSGSPLALTGGQTAHTFTAAGQQVGPANYPALNDRALPATGSARWWARVADAQGNVSWAQTTADRDQLPGGAVTADDYRRTPALVCAYDDDVTDVVVVVPGDTVAAPKRKTFSGLSGGGTVTYTVGVTALDSGAPEPEFGASAADGAPSRGHYRVEYRRGSVTSVRFSGPLHGPAAQAPLCEAAVAPDAAGGALVDVTVTLLSPVREQVTLEMRDNDAPGAPVWRWVAAGTATPAYAAHGTAVGPEAEFATTGLANARKLNDLALARDQVRRLWVRAVGKDTGISGPWLPVVLQVKEQPWLESVALAWNEALDRLEMVAVGGAFCRSARWEFGTDATFATVALRADAALADGGRATLTYPATGTIAEADRGKLWHGRVIPFNGAMSGSSATGLAGVAAVDPEMVPASEMGTMPPTARITPGAPVGGRSARTSSRLTYSGLLGAGGAAPLKWRRRIVVGDEDTAWPATWTTVAAPGTSFTSAETVTRDPSDATTVELEVQDAAGRAHVARLTLGPALPLVGPGGRLLRDSPFEGLARRLMDVDDDSILGREGRRRVDTVYDADGRLGGGVTVQDAGFVPRGLLGAARRALFGLADYNPATDSGGEIAKTAPLARLAPALPDVSASTGRIATIAGTAAATIRDEAKLGRTSAGEDPENLLVNGGGQLDPVANHPYGPMATAWTRVGDGFSLTTYDETPKLGDRVLCIHQQQPYHSGGSQSVYCHDAGEVWEVSGFIKVAQIYAAGGHAMVRVVVAAGGQILSTEGPGTGADWAGVPCDAVRDWRPVRIVFKPGVGWNAIHLLQGITALAYARSLYDGFVVRKLGAPQLRAISALNASSELVTGVSAQAHVAGRSATTVRDEASSGSEGRRRVDTLYYTDGYLRENLNVHDPNVAWRNLTDVSRRTQVGLAYANPDGSGGEIAKNAPLARIAPVLPAIHPSSGLLNRATATHDGGRLASEQAVSDFGNLIYNPSFEADANADGVADGWTHNFEGGSSGYAIISGVHGSYAQLQNPTSAIACSPFRVRGGERYRFGVAVGNPSASENAGFYLRVLWYGDTNDFSRGATAGFTDIVSGGQPVLPLNNWADFTGVVEAPASARYCRVALYTWGRSGPLYFDRAYAQGEDAYEGRRKVDTLYRADRQLQAGVQQFDGAREVRLAQFAQYGTTQDGNAVTFSPPFQNIPVVQFGPGQVTYDPALGNVRQRTVAEAVGLTSSGFTARLKVRQADVVLSTATISPSGGVCAKYTATEAYDDVYVFNYSVTVYSYSEYYGPYEPYDPYGPQRLEREALV